MPRENTLLYAFNRGRISPKALARIDLKKTQLASETQTNWIPRALGSMMLRPGLAYLGSTYTNATAKFIPFVFSTDDTALVEITDGITRVWVSDALITRASVSTAFLNGSFTSDVASWTDADESGATSVWVTGGYLGLTGDGTNFAIRRQTLTVATVDQNVEHAFTIVINRGPVVFRCGSTSGGDEYISETTLDTGTHSLSFTPTGASVYVQFSSRLKRQVLVDSIAVESSGVMTVASPWTPTDLNNIRWDQSGDILFIACDGFQQYKIERRSTTSWSVVKYYADDGPFNLINTSKTTIAASALSGNVTLTASKNLFKSTNVGSLYRITSTGQTVNSSVSAENTFTNTIYVTGTGTSRIFTITITGTWTATITLQRSFTSDSGPWEDVTTYSANTTVSYNDSLSNQLIWYRIGIKTGDYTSGTADLTLDLPTGSIDGIVRITAYSSETSVSAEVITDLGGTTATVDWYEGEWSSRRGYPTSVAFVEGRLGWSGRDRVWLSVTDDFYSFDDTTVGDSGPISRSIGQGPVDTVNWMLALQRLILGAEGAEFSCKSSSLDEPLTPTAFTVKPASTQGSNAVNPVKVDQTGIYIQRGGTRVMEILYGSNYEYVSRDLSIFIPEIGLPSITRMAVQRQPDTRIHCIRSDGTAGILIYDNTEDLLCWIDIETSGSIEDVVVIPSANGNADDDVYYVVYRTINGSNYRYLEKWAQESDCQGGTLNKQADSFITYSDVSTTNINGLAHLEGESVVVWGDGKYIGTYTVSGGAITGLSSAVSSAIIGLSYMAQYKSSKLAYAAGLGTALAQKKRISHLGVILYNTHYQGLQYGPDFTNLDNLPLVKDEAAVAADTVHSAYDEEGFEFTGNWDTDSRLCLQASAPKPCTVLGAVISIETHDKY